MLLRLYTAGSRARARTNVGADAVRQRLDEVPRVGGLGRGHGLGLRGAHAPVGDVGEDGGTGSWLTTEMWVRSQDAERRRTSTPSSSTAPALGS